MKLKRTSFWMLLIIIGAVYGWKVWQQEAALSKLPTQIAGPAVILFRGDNSPSCQAIHQLVDQAKVRTVVRSTLCKRTGHQITH